MNFIYRSPSLKVLKFTFVAGQRLFMDSDELEGKVSLLVLGGQGEFMGEGARRYSLEAGDVVVSEMSEPNSLVATSDLSVMLTITPYLTSACEMGAC
ncbi:MAG: cupin [Syntrophobacteraceae bacterium]